MNEPTSPASSKRTWTPWLILGFCVLALFLRVHVRYGSPHYLFYGTSATGRPASDAVTWYLHSVNLIEGRGFGENIRQFPTRNFVPPGHPHILAAIQMVTGPNPVRIGWVIAVLSSLLPWITYLWVREMWGSRVGVWAAFLAAIHAPFMHISFSMMSEPTAILSLSLVLLFGTRALRRRRIPDALLAGLVFGLAALVRPIALAFLWGSVGAILFLPKCSWRKRAALIASWLVMTAIPQGVWQFRNYRVHGVWATIYSSISARHLWTGVNPEYMPYFYSRGAWHETMWREPYASEVDSIRRMQNEASAWIRENRFKYAMSCIWRMAHLFPELRMRAVKVTYSQGGWGRFHLIALMAFAPLGLVIAFRSRTRRRMADLTDDVPGSLWAGVLLSGTLIALVGAGIYGASSRYRWPLEYAFIPFAALLLERLTRLGKQPVFGCVCYEVSAPVESAWKKLIRAVLLVALGLYMAAFAGLLIKRYAAPSFPEQAAPLITRAQIEERIRALSLWDEWTNQTPRWIEYEEVFREQAENYGEVVAADRKLVVWWGLLRLPVYDEQGYRSGYIIVEPIPDPLGKARLDLIRYPDIVSLGHNWRDGDIVTCIGRIGFRERAVGRPRIYTYEILRGRLEPDR